MDEHRENSTQVGLKRLTDGTRRWNRDQDRSPPGSVSVCLGVGFWCQMGRIPTPGFLVSTPSSPRLPVSPGACGSPSTRPVHKPLRLVSQGSGPWVPPPGSPIKVYLGCTWSLRHAPPGPVTAGVPTSYLSGAGRNRGSSTCRGVSRSPTYQGCSGPPLLPAQSRGPDSVVCLGGRTPMVPHLGRPLQSSPGCRSSSLH